MDKVTEWMLWIAGMITGIAAWVMRRLFRSVDKAHERITMLEKNIVDRAHLETQLEPIRQDLNLIIKHLLEKK